MKISSLILSFLIILLVSLVTRALEEQPNESESEAVEIDTSGDIKATELRAAAVECDCSDTLKEAIATLQSNIEGLQNERLALSEDVSSKSQQIESLENIKADLSEEVVQLRQTNKEQASELDKLSSSHESYRTENSKLLTEARLRIATLEAELAASSRKIQELSERSFVKQFQKEIMDLYNKFTHKK